MTFVNDPSVAVSPFNKQPPGHEYPATIEIFDGTIRKILLTPGTGVSIDSVLKIRDALRSAGVQHMLINVDWGSSTRPNTLEAETAKALLSDKGDIDFTVYSDSIIPYPQYALESYPIYGKDIVDTLVSWGATCVGPPLFDPGVDNRNRQMEALGDMASYAKSLGIDFVLGYGDVGRTNFDYFTESVLTATSEGAKRIDLYDSYCSLSPDGLERFIAALRNKVGDTPLLLHSHDDFGTASATAARAALLGVFPDVAVNGASYRAGFAALEEVVAILEFQHGVRTGVDTRQLTPLSELVAELSGLPLHPLKSVTGRNQWVRGGGPAMTLLRDGPAALDGKSGCFGAGSVGAQYIPVWDHRSNSFAIEDKLAFLGLPSDSDAVAVVEQRLRTRLKELERYPYWLLDDEMNELCRSALG